MSVFCSFVASVEEYQNVQNEQSERTESQKQAETAVSELSTPAKNIDPQILISAVQKRSVLWKTSEMSKTPSAGWQVWECVCDEIGLPRSDRKSVKEEWCKLRGKYMKAQGTYKKYLASQSGQAAKAQGKPFKSGFVYFEEMSFMSDIVDVPR